MTRRHKDEGPPAGTGGPSGEQITDARIVGHAPASRKCTGCAKPFTAVRKCRQRSVQAFAADDGRGGLLPVYLCGHCRDLARRSARSAFALPGVEKAANELEQLVLAKFTGPTQ